MTDTSQPTSGPMVSATSVSRTLSQSRKPIEPMMVSAVRTTTITESVAAWPICSVLKVRRERSAAEEPRSKNPIGSCRTRRNTWRRSALTICRPT